MVRSGKQAVLTLAARHGTPTTAPIGGPSKRVERGGEDALDAADPAQTRRHDPARTRASILAAGLAVFAEHGYGGANVNEIVTRAGTTKPMIYYHFRNKEGLFEAVLEDVYTRMREVEQSLTLTGLPPRDAMATFDYHAEHPDWIRLISVANIHGARHITGSATIATRNAAIVEILSDLLRRGRDEGVFRDGIDPVHLHLLIASVCFYRVSNRHTWRVIFQRDLEAADDAAQQREMVVESVLRYLAAAGDAKVKRRTPPASGVKSPDPKRTKKPTDPLVQKAAAPR